MKHVKHNMSVDTQFDLIGHAAGAQISNWCGRPATAASMLALALALGAGTPARAAVITLTADNTSSTPASFASSFGWSNAAAPAPTNSYVTDGFELRTASSSGSAVFQGDKLTINNNSQFTLKNATGTTVTVNSTVGDPGGLVLDNASIANGTANTSVNIAGLLTIGAGGGRLNPATDGRIIGIQSLITGSGSLVVQSTATSNGVVIFANSNNSYTGNLTVEAGSILRQTASNALSSAGAGNVIVDGTLQLRTGAAATTASTNAAINGLTGGGSVVAGNTASTLTIDGASGTTSFNGSISGVQLSLAKTGAGTQTLAGSNSYGGGTSIQGGTLKVTNNNGLGSGAVAISGGTLELDPVTIVNNLSFLGKADLTPHLLAADAGNVVEGNITLQDGGNATDNFNISAASGGSLTINGAITDSATTATNDSLNFLGDGDITVAGAITLDDGTDAITKDDAGTLTVSGGASADTLSVDGGQLNLASTLTTTGAVSVASGALLQQDGSFINRDQQAGSYNVDGTVDANGSAASMHALNGTGDVDNTAVGPATLTLGSAGNGTFTGGIQDTGGALSLAKDGSGTQSIGTIDVSGTVGVTGGALAVGTITNADDVNVNGGGLSVDGAATVADVTVASGASAAFNAAAGATTTTAASIDNSGTLTAGSDAGDVLDVAGAIANAGDLTTAGSVSAGGDVDNSGSIDIGGTLDTTGTLVSSNSLIVDGDASAAAATLSGSATFGSDLAVTDTLDNDATMTAAGNVSAGGDVTNTGSADIDGTFIGAALTNSGTFDVAQNATAGTVNLSAGQASFAGDLAVGGGSGAVSVSGGTNDVQGALTSGDVTVTGGSLALAGSNTIGTVDVSGGSVSVQNSNALAGGTAETNVSGTGRVDIEGSGLSIDEVFNLLATDAGQVQLSNVANANTISGAVNLGASTTPGQEEFRIESQSGMLNLAGGVTSSLSGGDEILNLAGAGGGTISGLSMTMADSSSIFKDGAGNWTISNADIDNANEIVSKGGILTLADAANIDGAAIFDLDGGSLDVSGVDSGSSYDGSAFGGSGGFLVQTGQTLTGGGTVTGDMVVAGGLDIGSSFGELVLDNLDLNGNLTIEVGGPQQNGLFNDLLTVNNLLDITDASLVFSIVGSLTRNAYVFATYGSLIPLDGPFPTVTGTPTDWSVIYGYGNQNQIALVRNNIPVPAPAPLALIGLGALAWGGLRRGRNARMA